MSYKRFETWMADKGNGDKTASCIPCIKQFAGYLSMQGYRPQTVGAGVLDSYIDYLKKTENIPYYPGVYNITKALVFYYTFLSKTAQIHPTWKLWLCVKNKESVDKAKINLAERESLRNSCFFDNDFGSIRNRAMVQLWLCGMRDKEITVLDVCDFDAENKTIYNRISEKNIPLCPQAFHALSEYLKLRETLNTDVTALFLKDEVMRGGKATRYSSAYFERIIRNYLNRQYLYQMKGYEFSPKNKGRFTQRGRPKKQQDICDLGISAQENRFKVYWNCHPMANMPHAVNLVAMKGGKHA